MQVQRSHFPATSGDAAHPANRESLREMGQSALDVLRVLRFRRWAFVIPFCLATSAAFLISLTLPHAYTTSVIFERIDDPVLRALPTDKGAGAFEYFRRILPREIKSAEVMIPVLDTLGLTGDLPRDADGNLTAEGLLSVEALREKLASAISVEWWERSEHSDTVELRYRGDDPRIMVPLVEEMREAYIRLARAKLRETLLSTRDYYEGLAIDQKARSDAIDQELTEFKLHNPGIDPTDPDTITYQLTVLRARLEELDRDKSRLDSELRLREAHLQGDLAESALPALAPSPVFAPPVTPAMDRLQNQIFELDQEMTELRLTRGMTDLHPRIQEITARRDRATSELTRLQSELSNSATTGTAPVLLAASDPLSLARKRIEMELESLGDQVAENERATRVNQESLARYEQMQANVFMNRRVFLERADVVADARAEYLKHKSQVQELTRRLGVEEMDKGIQFATIEPAKENRVAESPTLKSVVVLAIMAGLILGAGVVVLLELFDRRIRSPEQLSRYLGLPVLECIGEIVTASERRRNFIRRAMVTPMIVCLLSTMTLGSGFLAYCSLVQPKWYAAVLQWRHRGSTASLISSSAVYFGAEDSTSWDG